MAEATSSLPVPLSPWTSTLASEAATTRMSSKTFCIFSLLPTMFPKAKRRSSCSCKRVFCSLRSRIERTFSRRSRSWGMENGLVMKSAAPRRIASTAVSTVPCAVIITKVAAPCSDLT